MPIDVIEKVNGQQQNESALRATYGPFPTGCIDNCRLQIGRAGNVNHKRLIDVTYPSAPSTSLVGFWFAAFIGSAPGLENLPGGGFLLVPNHITWVDALVLQLACPRPIRYVIDQAYYHKPILHPILHVVGCIPINIRHSHAAVRAAAEKIADGEIVCVFPEGQLERTGTLLRLQRGFELIARHANAQVAPVWARSTLGIDLLLPGREDFYKVAPQFPYPVTIAFGKPLTSKTVDLATVREELLKLGELCFSRRASWIGIWPKNACAA